MNSPVRAWCEGAGGPGRNILVVSGRRLIAEALQELLAAQPGVEDCVVACDIAQVRDAVRSSPPSTVIVDLDDPGCSPDELTAVGEESLHARRIGLYDTFTAPSAQLAFDIGLTVLLPLTSTSEHLVDAVLADRSDSSATAAVGLTRQELARLGSLTPREVEVLTHLAQGRPVKAVAGLLGITEHTVETHKRRCFAKLGVQHQAHAVALATSAGLISSA